MKDLVDAARLSSGREGVYIITESRQKQTVVENYHSSFLSANQTNRKLSGQRLHLGPVSALVTTRHVMARRNSNKGVLLLLLLLLSARHFRQSVCLLKNQDPANSDSDGG